jgi:hypothetical protein
MAQFLIVRDGPSHFQAILRMPDGEVRYVSMLPSREAAEEWVRQQMQAATRAHRRRRRPKPSGDRPKGSGDGPA